MMVLTEVVVIISCSYRHHQLIRTIVIVISSIIITNITLIIQLPISRIVLPHMRNANDHHGKLGMGMSNLLGMDTSVDVVDRHIHVLASSGNSA